MIGVNIGANKDSADRIADYVDGRAGDGAGRATISRSTSARPTRRGCASCRTRARFERLLSAVRGARAPNGPPIFLKVAPDLGEGDPDQIVRAAIDHRIDAIIVSNTTVSRPPLKSSPCATRPAACRASR